MIRLGDGEQPISSSDSSSAPAGGDDKNKKLLNRIFSFLLMGDSVYLAAVGALGTYLAIIILLYSNLNVAIGSANSANDTGTVFVGLYLLVFASLLFGYELIKFTPIKNMELFYQKNFGFMSGPIGMGLYLLL